MAAPKVGERVGDLFASYKALPAGARKRAMASRLIASNEALIQATTDCLCGRRPLVGLRRPFRGCEGLDRVEPEDAMQAGRLAFAKALDQYDPAKGKFAYYLLIKTRYELRKVETYGGVHLLHVPENHVNSHHRDIALFGAFRELASGDEAESTDGGNTLKDWTLTTAGDLVDIDAFTPEDVAGWRETGEFPESLEAWEATKAAESEENEPPEPPPDSRTALERFLDEEVRFADGARVATTPLVSRWRFFAFSARALATDGELHKELKSRGARRTTMRVPWNHLPVEGFAGVGLQNAI